jgi:hypothetical protein
MRNSDVFRFRNKYNEKEGKKENSTEGVRQGSCTTVPRIIHNTKSLKRCITKEKMHYPERKTSQIL